ncbi:MAG: lysophospholipid acyltransferase family protein [Acidobacteria bacterium]|jgi:KDO2-lipid IV(A) lauroyltransferase|nr:lysophospholipid acyltransferase family protein [Acidobacteriota bacterium]
MNRARKLSLQDRAAVAILRGAGALPPRVADRLGAAAGRLLALARGSRRVRVAQVNVDLCFPDRSAAWRRDVVTRSLVHDGRAAMEAAIAWTREPGALLRYFHPPDGEEHLTAPLAAGRGVLLLAPHMGAWEAVNHYITARTPMTIMYLPNERPGLDALIHAGRNRHGATLVPASERGVRAVLKTLRAGGVSAILPDQVPDPSAGVFAPLFGHPTLTATLASKLLRVAKAAAVTLVCLRDEGRPGFRATYRPADPLISDDDLVASVTGLNRSVEAAIALDPGQYHWAYRRFKRPPPGQRDPYDGRLAR